jgi:hypothetical protein
MRGAMQCRYWQIEVIVHVRSAEYFEYIPTGPR